MEEIFNTLTLDIDGALLDTEHGMNLSLRDTILQYTGEEVDPDGLSKHFALPDYDALKDLGIAPIGQTSLTERDKTAVTARRY